MPAKNLRRISEGGVYCHIYNRGIEGRAIFRERSDYETFLEYLREYLTPFSPENRKESFTIQGRTFQGTPHLPKNYFGQVELLAYRLRPNHFHLLVHQLTGNSVQRLLRSLGTRYSIYFNKKYHRTGTLFDGPYKSMYVEGPTELADLISSLHRYPKEKDDIGNFYTSYSDYLGTRQTPWVNTQTVLPPSNKEKVLERPLSPTANRPHRLPYIFALIGIFFLLLGTGIRNIEKTNRVLGSSTPQTTSSPLPLPLIEVEAESGQTGVTIRKSPSIESEIIERALSGDAFPLISSGPEWYEIKLDNGTTGFVSVLNIRGQ